MRIGMIGTGRIAERFAKTVAEYYDNIKVVCVYNPRLESARKFAQDRGIDCYTDSLMELFEMVDSVYIASPHETHFEYAKDALESGRHVLCEKPLALTKNGAEQLFDMANEKGCILMEAVKTAYCPGFLSMMAVAKSGVIGEIRDVEAAFTRLTPTNVREYTDAEYGGSFMEFGSYCMLPMVKLLGGHYKNVDFKQLKAPTGVDYYTKAYVEYEKGMASCKTGLGVKSEGQLLISGTKGYILAESPWWMTKKFEVRFEDPNKRFVQEFEYEGSGLQYEIDAFAYNVAQLKEIKSSVKVNEATERVGENVDQPGVRVDELPNQSGARVDELPELFLGLTADESIAMAGIMEEFLGERRKNKVIEINSTDKISAEKNLAEKNSTDKILAEKIAETEEEIVEKNGEKIENAADDEVAKKNESNKSKSRKADIKFWAHRGCSMQYPENTLESFRAAADIPGITGIELDVQLTRDGEVVVFHDENVSRVTDGSKNVVEYTLEELKQLKISDGNDGFVTIPTLREVLELLKPYCEKNGLLINIELKTSVIRYEGIEEKTLELVRGFGLEKYIVYSSFLAESVRYIKELDNSVKTGMLGGSLAECIKNAREVSADALHPWIGGMDCEIPDDMKHMPVRGWNGEEPFFRDGRILREKNLPKYAIFGVTEVFTNVPEEYL